MSEVIPESLLDGCCCPVLLLAEAEVATGYAEAEYLTSPAPAHYATKWNWNGDPGTGWNTTDPYTETSAYLDTKIAANPVGTGITWSEPGSPSWGIDGAQYGESRTYDYSGTLPSTPSGAYQEFAGAYSIGIRLHTNQAIEKVVLVAQKDLYEDYAVDPTTSEIVKIIVEFSDDPDNAGWRMSDWLTSDAPSWVDGTPQEIRITIMRVVGAQFLPPSP